MSGGCVNAKSDPVKEVFEVLSWADKHVWTMMRPDVKSGLQWFVMMRDSSHYYAPTLYEALYQAWAKRDE